MYQRIRDLREDRDLLQKDVAAYLVVFDPRSVRDPGRSPCPDALLRVGVMRGVDEGLLGVLMD